MEGSIGWRTLLRLVLAIMGQWPRRFAWRSVVALEILRREPILAGAPFGEAGAYEKLIGVIRFAVDPARPAHRAIADLDRAPRNARGLVESWADFYLLRPVSGGSRRLLLDVPNRGRKMALALFNSVVRSNDPTAREDFGTGFLMRHGWTVAWVGWQPDVPRVDSMMALTVPRVAGVSGRVRCEFHPNAPAASLPLADRYHIPHPVARPDDPAAELTVREHGGAHAVAVDRSAWRFARAVGGAVVNLDRWVSEGTAPPPSAVPRIDQGTAVAAETLRATFESALPPKVGAPYVTCVPGFHVDGNDAAGVRPWELRVPLATCTGWNPRHPDQGAPGELMSMMGSTLPFPRPAAERARSGDPRLSIGERYRGRQDYLDRVGQAAEAMVGERHLLAEDVAAALERAGRLWDFIHGIDSVVPGA